MLLTAKLMLDWLKEDDMATRVRDRIARVIKEGKVHTYDMGGKDTDTRRRQSHRRLRRLMCLHNMSGRRDDTDSPWRGRQRLHTRRGQSHRGLRQLTEKSRPRNTRIDANCFLISRLILGFLFSVIR